MSLQRAFVRYSCRRELLKHVQAFRMCRERSTATLVSPVSEEALCNSMPFEEIPGPKPLPIIGNMHRYMPGIGEYSTKYWHDAQRAKYDRYGHIVREVFLPGISMVHLFDPKDMEAVTRYEGKYPKREFFTGMKKLREEKPHIYSTVGVAAGNGEEWHRVRSSSQKVLMRPQVMRRFVPQMNEIAEDMVQRMLRRRNDEHQVPELMQELFKWALESIIYIMFKRRMGCLSDDLSSDSMGLKFIQALNQFFQSTARVELTMLPYWRIFPSLSPSFRKLKKVHNFFFENAMIYVKEEMMKLEKLEDADDCELSAMQSLLNYCSPEDAAVMAIDSMAAGIDTTSLTVAYVIRNLAANPEAQRRLQQEIDTVLPNGAPLTAESIEKVPFLRACIKESMRLSPTVQGTSRTTQRDIVLSGYRIPAETPLTLNYFVSSLDERNFQEAHKYKPERWLKDGTAKESFAFQPFGFGPRMCIGRRIADLEMMCLLTKIMQNFWVENKHPEIDINFQLVLMIKSALKFEFYDRR